MYNLVPIGSTVTGLNSYCSCCLQSRCEIGLSCVFYNNEHAVAFAENSWNNRKISGSHSLDLQMVFGYYQRSWIFTTHKNGSFASLDNYCLVESMFPKCWTHLGNQECTDYPKIRKSQNRSNPFFSLVHKLYESTSIVITFNKALVNWDELSGEDALACALFYRLTLKLWGVCQN